MTPLEEQGEQKGGGKALHFGLIFLQVKPWGINKLVSFEFLKNKCNV